MENDELTTIEMTREELESNEEVIKRGIDTFKDVGTALLAIRDGRGYRFEYATFENYCRERWGFERMYAYRLIGAAKVYENLECIQLDTLPENEAQARPLVELNYNPELQREAWERSVDTAPNGKITAAHVQNIVDEIKQRAVSQPVAVTIFSNVSMEYYTPSKYVEAVRDVLGKIDLDPASCEDAQRTVKAKKYYTQELDGLSQEWHGNVFLNPPYCKELGKSNQGTWSMRLVDEYKKGNVKQAVLLVKAALGYKWFENLFEAFPVCFGRERLSFVNENGEDDGQSKQGTAFFYLGANPSKFYHVFRKFGRVIPPKNIVESRLFNE